MKFLEACTNFFCRFGAYICSFYIGLLVGQFFKLYIEKVRTSEPETGDCSNMKEPEKPEKNKTE